MLNTRKILIPSTQSVKNLISVLVLLAIPLSGLAEIPKAPAAKIETLSSVLDQKDYLRFRSSNPEQLKQVLSLYQYAAKDGEAVVQYWLGVMYFEGKGTDKDIEQAKHWLQLSAKQAYQPAEKYLSKIMQHDYDDEDDLDEDDC